MDDTFRKSGRILDVSLILVWVANGIIGTFLAVYVNELGGSLFEDSLVAAIPNIAALATSAPWGSLSDRLNDRKIFITIGNAALAATMLAFIFLKTSIQLLTVYGFGSIFIAASVPALSAYVTMTTTSSGRSLGRLLSAQSIGWAGGSLAGGFLYGAGRIQWSFWLGAITAIIGTLFFSLRFREAATRNGATAKMSLKEFRRVQNIKGVMPACIVGLLLMIGNNAFFSLFGVYLVFFLAGSKTLLGESAAFSALLGAFLAPMAGRLNDRFGRKPVLVLGGLIYSAFFSAILVFANPTIVAILWILPIYPLVFTPLAALISDFTSNSERGVGMGVLNTSMSLGRVMGPLLGGFVAVIWGIQPVAVLALLLGVISSVYSILFIIEGRPPIPPAVSLTEPEPSPRFRR